jgi:tRNA 2-thiouridine synthesizing protein A
MPKEPKELNEDLQEIESVVELDATGLYCPEPVMLLHNRIRDIAAGEALRLTATDPSTTRDVPKFCLYLGHDLVENSRHGNNYIYLIRKKEKR